MLNVVLPQNRTLAPGRSAKLTHISWLVPGAVKTILDVPPPNSQALMKFATCALRIRRA
jgi:hypothetical protein